jgi:PAS domain S-box-containing protein
MNTDRNLLFGVLALQAGLIDAPQFIEACLLWTTRKSEHLADLLLERGWIEPADRAHVEYLLERKLHKHGGDAHASFAAIPDEIKRSLAALADDDVQRSLAGEPVKLESQLATIEHVPAQADRYCRLRLHATGGIGRVWLAHDSDLGRDVALKELRPEQAEHATLGARFLQEAQITGQLEHPGVIPVYELVRARNGQQPFYTMRFVKGRTLSEAAHAYHERRLADQADALEFPALLNAFVTVCNTVAYAHSRGVIHRDLKGQNVLLGDFGEVVVLDWGLAKLIGRPESETQSPAVVLAEGGADSGHTVQGQALGTPAYMAPEQAAGRLDLIDRRTDVYGLGAIFYEILTGVPPFTGRGMEEVLRKVREEEPVPPRQCWPEVPPALEAVCLRALAKQPADRPATATELTLEVQGWQEFERRKAEQALRDSEALYHSLVESLPCVVVRKDLEGRFTFANYRFLELAGRTLEGLLGKTDYDIDNPPELAAKYQRDDLKVIETGRVFEDIEEVIFRGCKHYYHTLKSPIRDAAGRITGVQVIAWDVTARKLAEEELRKSRERFELAVLGSQDGLWDWDLTTDEVYYSPRYKAMLGYEDHDFPNRREEWEKRVHPDDLERVNSELSAHYRSRESLSWIEFRMRHKDGSYRWIRSRAFVLRDPTGQVYRVAGSFEDITDRKNAEDELAHERYLLRSLMDTVPDKIYFKDRDSRFIRVNKDLAENCGLADAMEALGKTDADFFTQEHAEQARADEREILRTGQPIIAKEEKETWFDGRVTWASTTKLPLRDPQGRVIGTIGISRDITERKRAEEALAQERHLLHTIMDHLPDAVYFKDTASRFTRVNKAVADLLGLDDPAQLVGKSHFDFFTEEAARLTAADDQEIMRTGQPLVGKDEQVTWPDGRQGWLSTTKMPFRDRDGTIIGVFGVSRDITQRKQAELALRQSDERYRSVIAAMQDGIVLLDADGSIRACNASAERILGLSADQMLGRTSLDPRWGAIREDGTPFPEESRPPVVTLRTGKPCSNVVMGVRRPDGTVIWLSVNSQPLLNPDGTTLAGVVACFADVTDRRRTEEALRQTGLELTRLQQRLECGGVAGPQVQA